MAANAVQLKPQFFIVGAAKSGTTSLASYLGQHPDIFMPPPYAEPAFFADDTGDESLDKYLCNFISSSQESVAGEKSVAYLFDTKSAERISAFFNAAKIIIVLREHVDMAYSFYWHNRREGLEPLVSFQLALDVEDTRFSDPDFRRKVLGYHANFFYRRRATYMPQLARFYNVFPPTQIKLLTFDQLSRHPVETTQELYRWLGVDSTWIPNIRPENRGGTMRWQWLQDAYMQRPLVRQLTRMVTPYRLRRRIYAMNRTSGGVPPLQPDLRAAVAPLFDSDRTALMRSFGITFNAAA